MQSYVRYSVDRRFIIIREEWESNGVLETMGEITEASQHETAEAAHAEAMKLCNAEPNSKRVFAPVRLAA